MAIKSSATWDGYCDHTDSQFQSNSLKIYDAKSMMRTACDCDWKWAGPTGLNTSHGEGPLDRLLSISINATPTNGAKGGNIDP